MKGAILAATALSLAMLMGTGSAVAAVRTVSDFMTDCQSDAKLCNAKVGDVIAAAKSAHYACLPQDLSADEATRQELAWLRKRLAASDRFANENLEDALFTGVAELWPCGKR